MGCVRLAKSALKVRCEAVGASMWDVCLKNNLGFGPVPGKSPKNQALNTYFGLVLGESGSERTTFRPGSRKEPLFGLVLGKS